MKKIILMLALVSAVSCIRNDIDEILLMRDDISLTIKENEEFAYNPATCQMSYNSTTNEYRVHDDKLSEWFVLKCDEMPANEGQKLTADLTWTASSSTKNMKGLEFKVEKTDQEGRIWMWCKKKRIGIVIKNL